MITSCVAAKERYYSRRMLERFDIRCESLKVTVEFQAFNSRAVLISLLGITVLVAAVRDYKQLNVFSAACILFIGVLFAYILMRSAFGREELEFTSSELICRRSWLGYFPRAKTYTAIGMSQPGFRVWHGRRGSVHTGIAFHYCGEDVHICEGITKQQAKVIADTVLQKLPKLEPIWKRYEAGADVTGDRVVLDLS
jgi:hypothetical protein